MVSQTVPDGSQIVGIRFSPDILAKLDKQAGTEMRTRANLIRKIIAEYYQEA